MRTHPARVRPLRPSDAGRRLLALAAAVFALVGSTSAQYVPRRQQPKPIDFATSQNDNLFTLQRSQDDIHSLETALAELAAGENDAAVMRLHELLRAAPRGVVPVGPGRYIGVRTAVVTVLANLSPAAREAYDALAEREAGRLFAVAPVAMSDRQLEQVAERFPTSRIGRQARLLLGDRALERGDGVLAAQQYRAAIDATEIGSSDERRAVDRLYGAEALADPRSARARATEDRLPPTGGDVLRVLPPSSGEWAAYGGGRAGDTPMADPVGNPRPFYRDEVTAPGFDQRERGELAMHAVGDLDGIFVNTGRNLVAFDPLRGTRKWETVAPLGDTADQRDDIEDDWRYRRRRGGSRWETTNQDMVLAAAVSGNVVVCALQVPDNTVEVEFQRSFRIMSKMPRRRLFAYSRDTGEKLWAHFDELDGPITRRFRGHDSCGPPLIAGDTVYAPMHDSSGAIKFTVAAYDLRTGRPKWRHMVCSSQQDVNMFGNARMEFASSPLSLHGGVLFGATNLGVAFAVDARDGRIRWVRSYDVVTMPRAMLRNQADRPVYFANNPPVVCDGVVCMTPLDSPSALGFEVDTGELLWELGHDARIDGIENRVQWLCGCLGDEFVLSGIGVVGVQARPAGQRAPDPALRGAARFRQLVRPDQIAERRMAGVPGRPALTRDHVWMPTREGLLPFGRDGQRATEHPAIRMEGIAPGNLMLVDGVAVALRNRNMDVILDPNALLARSEDQVREHPDDPTALLRLASLRRALLTGDSTLADNTAVQELYRRGLQACIDRGMPTDHPVRVALQTELFEQARKVATVAVESDSPDALERLAAARELAPSTEEWIEMQTILLARCRGNRELYLRELGRLDERAPLARMPAPLEIPVAAFVQWQRALAHENEPARACVLWQQLLEQHGDQLLGTERLADLAERHIEQLIDAHGAEVYAEVAARADAALAAAGSDEGALTALTRRYPNSEAARRASLTLLDAAVRSGDLRVAADVFAHALRNDAVTPGILRRMQVAALARDNHPLARVLAERLAPFDEASDWAADDGRAFADAARAAVADLPAPTSPPVARPLEELAKVSPRTRQEYLRMLEARTADGFSRPADAPLYAVARDDLVAFDIAGGGAPRELFAEQVEFLEHALLCGETLVVPDMLRLFALDYRSGRTLWEVEFEQPRLIESLDVTAGVLHVTTQPQVPDGNSELLGVEPKTGAVLFRRALGEGELKPKPTGHDLLMAVLDEPLTIHRLDPLTGRTVTEVSCAAALGPGKLHLPSSSLATKLYPKGICADRERIYLPCDDRAANPQVFALTNDGQLAWHWQGESGARLLLAQRRGDRFVVAEDGGKRAGFLEVLDATNGESLYTVQLGQDVVPLNWQRSWNNNQLPAQLAIHSLVDRQSRQGQVFVVSVDPGPTFVVPLGADDGTVDQTPRFGDGFVTFGVRPRNAGGRFRLYGIDLQTREGIFEGGSRYRFVRSPGSPHGMHAAGAYTVLSTTDGLILLGSQTDRNR